ncbi:hypothetical protein B4N84_13545 [Flavobacterium sp. IR1]|nr:hypothetical protein B4N84_13545 [Flavobacterium sp. IR1]
MLLSEGSTIKPFELKSLNFKIKKNILLNSYFMRYNILSRVFEICHITAEQKTFCQTIKKNQKQQ